MREEKGMALPPALPPDFLSGTSPAMTNRILLLALGALLIPHGLRAASSAGTEKEYQQVRTIALRDARVQSAYRDADRRLDAKIIQIDPALETYVKAKQAAREGIPSPKPATQPFVAAKPATKPAPAKPAATGKSTHIIASGETLSGIAANYRVSVAALKSANHIQDERKLRVGQTLTIPSGKSTPPAKKDESAWSRLMH
jgi:LysM repeat protein